MLGKEIQKIRKSKGISVDALSVMSNVQPYRIKSFENNDVNITVRTLQQILHALGKKIIITDDK